MYALNFDSIFYAFGGVVFVLVVSSLWGIRFAPYDDGFQFQPSRNAREQTHVSDPLVSKTSEHLVDSPRVRNRHLILDVGFNVGGDAQAYLSHGYDVVGVEANPLLVQEAERSERFKEYVSAGQLKLANIGVAEKNDYDISFWAHASSPELGRLGKPSYSCMEFENDAQVNKCTEHKVPVMTCQRLMDDYGVPLYLKIDIEGSEAACIFSLRETTNLCSLPFYISFQSMKPRLVTRTQTASDMEAALVLAYLKRLGYRYFKQTVLQSRYNQKQDITWPGMASGPFGEWALDNVSGVLWTDMQHVDHFRDDDKVSGEWVDIHARLPGLPKPCKQ